MINERGDASEWNRREFLRSAGMAAVGVALSGGSVLLP